MRYAKEWWNYLLPESFVMHTKTHTKKLLDPLVSTVPGRNLVIGFKLG